MINPKKSLIFHIKTSLCTAQLIINLVVLLMHDLFSAKPYLINKNGD
jgi:hypothetical protein